jgi:hypothetical protein
VVDTLEVHCFGSFAPWDSKGHEGRNGESRAAAARENTLEGVKPRRATRYMRV